MTVMTEAKPAVRIEVRMCRDAVRGADANVVGACDFHGPNQAIRLRSMTEPNSALEFYFRLRNLRC